MIIKKKVFFALVMSLLLFSFIPLKVAAWKGDMASISWEKGAKITVNAYVYEYGTNPTSGSPWLKKWSKVIDCNTALSDDKIIKKSDINKKVDQSKFLHAVLQELKTQAKLYLPGESGGKDSKFEPEPDYEALPESNELTQKNYGIKDVVDKMNNHTPTCPPGQPCYISGVGTFSINELNLHYIEKQAAPVQPATPAQPAAKEPVEAKESAEIIENATRIPETGPRSGGGFSFYKDNKSEIKRDEFFLKVIVVDEEKMEDLFTSNNYLPRKQNELPLAISFFNTELSYGNLQGYAFERMLKEEDLAADSPLLALMKDHQAEILIIAAH